MAIVGDIMDTMDMVIMDITMVIMVMDIGEDVAAMDTTDTMDVVSNGYKQNEILKVWLQIIHFCEYSCKVRNIKEIISRILPDPINILLISY